MITNIKKPNNFFIAKTVDVIVPFEDAKGSSKISSIRYRYQDDFDKDECKYE